MNEPRILLGGRNGKIHRFGDESHLVVQPKASNQFDSGERCEQDARLLAASYTSYEEHCIDPVKAAEDDLFGCAIERLRMIHSECGRTISDHRRFRRYIKSLCDEILSHTKEPSND